LSALDGSQITNDEYAQTIEANPIFSRKRSSSRPHSNSSSQKRKSKEKKQTMMILKPAEYLGRSKFKASNNLNYTLEDRQKLQTQIGPRN